MEYRRRQQQQEQNLPALQRLGRWLRLKQYQIEVTFGVYMFTPVEKFVFCKWSSFSFPPPRLKTLYRQFVGIYLPFTLPMLSYILIGSPLTYFPLQLTPPHIYRLPHMPVLSLDTRSRTALPLTTVGVL
jgi:hypothetical protein